MEQACNYISKQLKLTKNNKIKFKELVENKLLNFELNNFDLPQYLLFYKLKTTEDILFLSKKLLEGHKVAIAATYYRLKSRNFNTSLITVHEDLWARQPAIRVAPIKTTLREGKNSSLVIGNSKPEILKAINIVLSLLINKELNRLTVCYSNLNPNEPVVKSLKIIISELITLFNKESVSYINILEVITKNSNPHNLIILKHTCSKARLYDLNKDLGIEKGDNIRESLLNPKERLIESDIKLPMYSTVITKDKVDSVEQLTNSTFYISENKNWVATACEKTNSKFTIYFIEMEGDYSLELVEDTLVYTDKGLIKVNNLEKGDKLKLDKDVIAKLIEQNNEFVDSLCLCSGVVKRVQTYANEPGIGLYRLKLNPVNRGSSNRGNRKVTLPNGVMLNTALIEKPDISEREFNYRKSNSELLEVNNLIGKLNGVFKVSINCKNIKDKDTLEETIYWATAASLSINEYIKTSNVSDYIKLGRRIDNIINICLVDPEYLIYNILESDNINCIGEFFKTLNLQTSEYINRWCLLKNYKLPTRYSSVDFTETSKDNTVKDLILKTYTT